MHRRRKKSRVYNRLKKETRTDQEGCPARHRLIQRQQRRGRRHICQGGRNHPPDRDGSQDVPRSGGTRIRSADLRRRAGIGWPSGALHHIHGVQNQNLSRVAGADHNRLAAHQGFYRLHRPEEDQR